MNTQKEAEKIIEAGKIAKIYHDFSCKNTGNMHNGDYTTCREIGLCSILVNGIMETWDFYEDFKKEMESDEK